jgi:hypothetical protein
MRITSFLFLASVLGAMAATEEQVHKQFSVQAGGTLLVDVGFGSINVRTNGTGEVAVDVWRKIGRKNKADEEAFLRDNPVEFHQEGSTVSVQSHGHFATQWSWRGRDHNEAKYTITVPSRFSVQLRTGGGGVDVSDLTGDSRVRSGGGSLALARLHGALDGDTGGGGVNAQDCEGAINLHSGGGGIDVAGGSGSLRCDTGGGSVSVRGFNGPAQVGSGGGGLTIENVTGEVDGSTGGGSITAVLPPAVAQPVKLSTGGGGISISVAGSAAFMLDARTGGGSVSSDLPVTITGKLERDHLEGPVNGGGKTVVLRSGGGSIHVRKLAGAVSLER